MPPDTGELFLWTRALLAGLALGLVYFGGLWWTVMRAPQSPTPMLWFVGSLLLRTLVALSGFYFVSEGQALQLGVCLLGFVAARALVLVASKKPPAAMSAPTTGPSP